MICQRVSSCGFPLMLVLGGLVLPAPAGAQTGYMHSPPPQIFSSIAGAPSGTGWVDPCALVTKAEAEAIVGAATTQRTRTIARGLGQTTKTCSYNTASYTGVSVSVTNRADMAMFTMNRTMSGARVRDVPGVGDAAFGTAGGISVLSGTTFFSIVAPGGANALRELATRALGRI